MLLTNIIPSSSLRRRTRKSLLTFQFRSKRYAFEKNEKFPNYLSILAVAKDECPYLKEWIEYHKMLGVEKFYVYDNDSTDNTKQVLSLYIEKGIVVYEVFHWSSETKVISHFQRKVYTKAVRKYKNKTRWLAIIDIDEFIVPKKHDSIPEFLKDYEAYSQIFMHWKYFGNSGHKTKPEGLVSENYVYADKEVNPSGKSIVNPRAILGQVNVHYNNVIGMPVDERKIPYLEDPSVIWQTANIIQLNHYWSKSDEERKKRIERIKSALQGKGDIFNDVYDDSIKKFIPNLKERMTR
jgi:hypothetical protein